KVAWVFGPVHGKYWRSELIAGGLFSEADDFVDQFRIRNVRLLGGFSEVLFACENGIGVGFDEDDFISWREPQIEPRIAVDGEQPVDFFADLFDVSDQIGW